ncbi:Uu.00g055950.m01.CDS01 [Anthostomella pinea]|uniref:Uu.00g055950.m01.CDS01 n=1 Tax=Anthostomella pinea TaxID=933095 RepID=A0AAI8VXJ4_9PEZI|nr:Uu.00g055950.m01.CDS01 [Anthostomella pinea]
MAETDTTIVLAIGDSQFVLEQTTTVVALPGGPERFIPATAVDGDGDHFGHAELEEACIRFRSADDVWTEAFLEVLLLQSVGPLQLSASIERKSVQLHGLKNRVPNGPYAIHSPSGKVYSLLKLYEDTSNAFIRGTIRPAGHSRYKWLHSTDHIAVPSRLSTKGPDAQMPLRGLRFAVKDAIDVAGLETGCGSSCYRSFYPPQESSAAFINQLVSAGAVLVGKTRLGMWCDGQDPTERLEEVTPTNPRGDGFQKPGGSSSGSAAATASYPWLDFTIGTDTGGSVRHPAGLCGVFGMRPSHGSNNSSGLVCAASMDTPGIFARSVAITRDVSRVMMDQSWDNSIAKPDKLRYKILYAVESDSSEPSETPRFFSSQRRGPEANTPAGLILESFARDLENHLGCKRQEVCLDDLWMKTRPEGAPESLVEATGTIYQTVLYYELMHDVVQPFIKDYQAARSRAPFIEPITKARLDYGAGIPKAVYEQSVAALKTYATWVNEVLLPLPSSEDTEGTTIPLLVYPQSWGRPQYRNDGPRRAEGNIFWSGVSTYSISYCSGCPDVTVPLGETGFQSKFTESREHLPVAVSVLAPRGMDNELLSILADLEAKKVLKPVQCGSRLYAEGQSS